MANVEKMTADESLACSVADNGTNSATNSANSSKAASASPSAANNSSSASSVTPDVQSQAAGSNSNMSKMDSANNFVFSSSRKRNRAGSDSDSTDSPKQSIKKRPQRAVTKKEKSTILRSMQPAAPLDTSNRFQALDINDSLATATQSEHEDEVTQATVRVPKAPAITLAYEDRLTTIGRMRTLGFGFKVENSLVKARIKPDNMDDWTAIQNYLKENKLPFFTHPAGSNAQLHVVVFSIPNISAQIIGEALVRAGRPPVNVTEFGSHPIYKHYAVDFAKQVTSVDDLNENCDVIFSNKITWKKNVKKSNGPTMCFNCLQYGHGQATCHLPTVCSLCAGAHHGSLCPSKNSTTPIVRCGNCVANKLPHEHYATDENCGVRLQRIEKTNMLKAKRQAAIDGKKKVKFDLNKFHWPGAQEHVRPAHKFTSAKVSAAVSFAQTAATTSSSAEANATQTRSRSHSRNSTSSSDNTRQQSRSRSPRTRSPRARTHAQHNNRSDTHSDVNGEQLFSLPEMIGFMIECTETLMRQPNKTAQLNAMMTLISKWLTKP